jgi:hypothetical protein
MLEDIHIHIQETRGEMNKEDSQSWRLPELKEGFKTVKYTDLHFGLSHMTTCSCKGG